jgi:hypothetical protein
MVNRHNKDNAMISRPLLAKTDVGKKLQVMTKPAVSQASLESLNMQEKTMSIKKYF